MHLYNGTIMKFDPIRRILLQNRIKEKCIVEASRFGLIVDVGSGDYPLVSADLLCDLNISTTVHRRGPLKTLGKPFVRCDVQHLQFMHACIRCHKKET